ncbi:MAG TPA: hypothetical protein VFC10_07385 [Terriglobia bacterium]|jgi:hypothetical protein|nr:hypothetical protein [Terracidiphilus sp.]HZT69556.1 hypothetical protein [Terriglobia bacterium]
MLDLGIGGLFTGPVDALLHVGDDKLQRQAMKSVLSAGYSAAITALFETGRKGLLGEGHALQQTARALWLSLQPMVESGLLDLSVPQDLLNPDELARFQTAYNSRRL